MSTFYRGATVTVNLTITDQATGVPVDLTGATVKFRLAGTLGINASYEGTMALGGTAGTASLTIPAGTTADLNGTYNYTVYVTEASTAVFIGGQGTITFTNIVLASS